MIIGVILSFIFILFIMIKNLKNQYSWMFFMLFLSLNLIIISLVFYNIKLSNYRTMFEFENILYILLSRVRLSFPLTRNIVNLGVAMFIFAKLNIINFGYKKRYGRKYRIAGFLLTMCFSIIYFYVNSFSMAEKIYIRRFADENSFRQNTAEILKSGIIVYNTLLLAASFLVPYIYMLNKYLKTPIAFKKTQAKMTIISLAVIDVFFTVMFILGPFRGKVFNNIDLDTFVYYPITKNYYFYSYFPLIMLVMLNTICFILFKYNILDSLNIMRNKTILKNVKIAPKDIRHVMHAYKNTLLTIMMLEEEIKKNYGSEEVRPKLDEIYNIASDFLKRSSSISDASNGAVPNIKEADVIQCVDEVIFRLNTEKITIEKKYTVDYAVAFIDTEQISEALYNIFTNAVEAIEKAKRENGKINVDIYADDDWICICIRDNGCGIARKDLKNVFKPLYSTKNTLKNWGLGLSYVYNVVKAHLGIIFVNSVPDEFTEFQIMLPTSQYDGNSIWE